MIEIFGIACTIVFAIIYGQYDGSLMKLQIQYKYWPRYIFRGTILGAFPVLLYLYTNIPIWGAVIYLLNLMAWFWIVFELSINKKIGKGLFRIGETSRIDRITRFLFGEYEAFTFRLIVLFITGMGYVLYFDHIYA